ncbi:MAG: hypothetical protein GF334_06950 [Candidatus Altiarchaeales archaeon]|nr:hypothetical protein [Candidatus Altiarchaeales archaeon]
MDVKIKLGLSDVPGTLLKVLDPISRHGGNIQTVHHTRGDVEDVGVEIVFGVRDQRNLDFIVKSLEQEKIPIWNIQVEGIQYYNKKSVTFIFIGHVIDQDIQDTVDRLNRQGLVLDVDVRMSDPNSESAVLLRMHVDSGKYKSLQGEIKKIADEKDFLCVNQVVGGLLE